MTWNPNIPTPEQSPASSQPSILINNQTWPVIFSENHVPMNNNNQGNHAEVIFRQQVTDPLIIGDWGNIYCKSASSATGTKNQLFYRTKKFIPDQPNSPQQLTFTQVNISGTDQQTFLIGGFLVFMGTFSLISAGGGGSTSQTITVSPVTSGIKFAIANFNTIIPSSSSNAITTTILSTSQFKVTISPDGSSQSYSIKYTAIGIQ